MHLFGFISVLMCFYFAKADSVLDLTDNDFSTIISEHETILVMFYAPWCGHCKKLKPEFERAALLLEDSDPPITLAKVDCTEAGKETCNKFSVSGYPTLKIFSNGEVKKEYQGPRDAGGIVKYMKAQVGPSAKDLKTVKDFETFINKDEVGVVGFFEKESDLKGEFLKIADKLREKFRFGISTVPDVLAKQGVKDGIVLFRAKNLQSKFEENFLKYGGAANKADIDTWINKNYHGLVGHRTQENSADFKPPVVVAFYNVDYVKNPKGTNYWRNRILKVAKDYSKDFTFAVSSKDDFQHELNEFGFDYVPSDKPLVLARDDNKKKFVMKDEFRLTPFDNPLLDNLMGLEMKPLQAPNSLCFLRNRGGNRRTNKPGQVEGIENFEKFLKDLKAGGLEPYLKSEPVPEDNSGPVKVAVAKNFDEVVTNNGQDTLIEFYAPWCGHCKKLAPTWDELGEKMKDEDVAIVKMDASNNDVPGTYEVRGFPTLYWAPKDSKSNPVRYEGGRELDDFVKYIAKSSTSELKGYDRKGNEKKKTEL